MAELGESPELAVKLAPVKPVEEEPE